MPIYGNPAKLEQRPTGRLGQKGKIEEEWGEPWTQLEAIYCRSKEL